MIFLRAASCTSSIVSLHNLSPSSFLSSLKCSNLKEDIWTSKGITASAPYARRNGVSPVAILWVVRYDQSIPGISSALPPFDLSLERVEDCFVGRFRLSITFGVSNGSESEV